MVADRALPRTGKGYKCPSYMARIGMEMDAALALARVLIGKV